MKRSKHLARAISLIVLGLACAVILRFFLVPKSYGEEGHFRFDAIAEARSVPLTHGGRESCAGCHEDNYKQNQGSKHAAVHCEGCHEPVTRHADPSKRDGPDKGKFADMPVHKTWRLCARCHQRLQARPATFPQIEVVEHVRDKGADFAEDVCFECHNPHSPED